MRYVNPWLNDVWEKEKFNIIVDFCNLTNYVPISIEATFYKWYSCLIVELKESATSTRARRGADSTHRNLIWNFCKSDVNFLTHTEVWRLYGLLKEYWKPTYSYLSVVD